MVKNKLLVGVGIFVLGIITNNVYATNLEMQLEQEQINMGDTISIKLELKDIDQEQGINIIQGKLEYDKNIFEKVENDDFTSKNNWSMLYNDEDTNAEGKFILLNLSEGQKENQEVTEVKLKVKDNIKSTNTNIKISEISTVENDDIIELEDSVEKIKVKGKFSFKNMFINWKEAIENFLRENKEKK